MTELRATDELDVVVFATEAETSSIMEVAEDIEKISDGLPPEAQEKLNDALQKLSLRHRTVVILHEIEGLEHAQIAEITKTSIGTVRSRLHYAKQQLQSYLQDYIT